MGRTGDHACGTLATAVAAALAALTFTFVVTPARPAAAAPTGANDDVRTGWYPDQPGLSPAQVSRTDFGQLFDSPVNGQVYAQPIVSNGTLLVATETNEVYGLDPVTGGQRWVRHQLHAPFDPTDVPCGDLTPWIGVTGTPVVDPAGTGTMYFFAKGYVSGTSGEVGYWFHAVDVTTGQDRFAPVRIRGNAQNQPGITFDAKYELQRPALLLQNGVVYGAFGGHCDQGTYQGWVVGVATNGTVKAMWSAVESGGIGNGIWQSGSGIMSDGPGRLFVATGNGPGGIGPTAGSTPPASCSECVIRLSVQSDGTLAAQDFYRVYDADNLDAIDADFASGGPVELPATMGTPSHPRPVVAVGKEGYVYLLDADHLGGYRQGPSGGDGAMRRVGPDGGVWSKPAVWPGDGGWVYLPTAAGNLDASGSSGYLHAYQVGHDSANTPTLSLQTNDVDAPAFGFGSSAPVVTSSGTTAGSAVVWVVWMAGGDGNGAQLRVYDAVPVAGHLNLLHSWPVGQASKFDPPGIAGNRVYVGTRDGHVKGFGVPAASPLSSTSLAFPTTTVGASATLTATVTVNASVAIQSLAVEGASFASGAPSIGIPSTHSSGESFTVPVTFTPTKVGSVAATLHITTNVGVVDVGLSGIGQSSVGVLNGSPLAVSFGGVAQGSTSSTVVTLANVGAQPVTISSVTAPPAPFVVAGAPAVGTVLAAQQSLSVAVSFSPTADGSFTGNVVVASSGGTVTFKLSGISAQPGSLTVSSTTVDAGAAVVGAEGVATFFVTNTGGLPLSVTRSKPPVGGVFVATTDLFEGSVIAPGESRRLTVAFRPNAVGPVSDRWELNGSGSSTLTTVILTGVGLAGLPTAMGLLQTVPPARLADTRTSTSVAAGTSLVVPVAGHGGVPSTATGALVNLAVTQPSGPGFVTAYPCGSPVPLASNVNYARGQTVANLAAVDLGAAGAVCVYVSAGTHVVVDVDGYFSATAGSFLNAIAPARTIDTRTGSKVGPGVLVVPIAGHDGVPDAASGAVVNVTVTQPDGPGFATVFPCGQPLPPSSNVNFAAGDSVANLSAVSLGTGGAACIYTSVATHVVVDVSGYLMSSNGEVSATNVPFRLFDSRPSALLGAGSTQAVTIVEDGTASGGAAAALMTVTVAEPTGPGFVTAYPCGQPLPPSSSVNFHAGETVANLVLVRLGVAGGACVYASVETHVVVDLNGWTAPSA